MKYPIRPSTLKSAKRSPTTCRIQTHSNYLVRGASQRTFVPVRAGGIGRLRLSLRSPIFAALRQTREVLIPPADYSQSLAPGSGREIPRVWPMAEKEGFEPPVPFPVQLISSQSHSATLPLLLYILQNDSECDSKLLYTAIIDRCVSADKGSSSSYI